MKTDYKELDEARKLLGLNETATLKEVKDAYRRLSHRHHPDKNNGDGGETMKEINRAFEQIMGFIDSYAYIFTEREAHADFFRQHIERFYDGGF